MYIFLCLAASPVLLKPVTKKKQPAVVPKKNVRKLSQSVSIVDVDSDVEEEEEEEEEKDDESPPWTAVPRGTSRSAIISKRSRTASPGIYFVVLCDVFCTNH